MLFFKIQHATWDTNGFAWAGGYGPLENMPFLSLTELESLRDFWRVNPMPAGMRIDAGGKKWPDFLGQGGSGPLYFVSEHVVDSLTNETIGIARLTEMPIAEINAKALRKVLAPKYFVLEAAPGIEMDYEASGIPIEPTGKPLLETLPKGPIIWKLRLKSWTGADLIGWPNIWKQPSASLICTERVKELAARKAWTNVRFKQIEAV